MLKSLNLQLFPSNIYTVFKKIISLNIPKFTNLGIIKRIEYEKNVFKRFIY